MHFAMPLVKTCKDNTVNIWEIFPIYMYINTKIIINVQIQNNHRTEELAGQPVSVSKRINQRLEGIN